MSLLTPNSVIVRLNDPTNGIPNRFWSNQFAPHLPIGEQFTCLISAFDCCTVIGFEQADISRLLFSEPAIITIGSLR